VLCKADEGRLSKCCAVLGIPQTHQGISAYEKPSQAASCSNLPQVLLSSPHHAVESVLMNLVQPVDYHNQCNTTYAYRKLL
jgi:hypothetical protein